MSNIGEVDEPLVIQTLVRLKGRTIDGIGRIDSVADYRGVEFPPDIQAKDVPKAPGHSKRDVTINRVGYSIKSKRAAPAAIVNHTTREKWLRVCESVGVTIDLLDEMVKDYWELRQGGRIGEDTRINDAICPFRRDRDYLSRLITYFLFTGTGTKDSEYPADYILEFDNPQNVETWNVLNKDNAFDALWSKFIFSLRANKGMPTDYANMRDPHKKSLMRPWVRHIDGDYRGALHIRAR